MSDVSRGFGEDDPELQKRIAACNSQAEIQQTMIEFYLERGAATQDAFNPAILIPTSVAEAKPRRYAKAVTVNGQKHILEGDTQQEVDAAEIALYRSLQETPAEPTDAELEAEAARTVTDADVRTRLLRGESDAIGDYLQSKGVSMDLLQRVSDLVEETSWSDASEAFLHSAAGQDWAGGEQNLATMRELLAANPELCEHPSVETLAAVWQHMKTHNMVAENPDVVRGASYEAEIAAAGSAAEVAEVNKRYFGNHDSALFGGR